MEELMVGLQGPPGPPGQGKPGRPGQPGRPGPRGILHVWGFLFPPFGDGFRFFQKRFILFPHGTNC